MAKTSAALLLYRRRPDGVELLLGHMGGPFWSRKDDGGWSIPKGEHDGDEESLAAARREFHEELGAPAPDGPALDLGDVRTSSGKRVHAWAVEGEFDASAITSNMFELEWPPRSGRIQQFPELDRAAWLDAATARRKLTKSQQPFVDRLEAALAAG